MRIQRLTIGFVILLCAISLIFAQIPDPSHTPLNTFQEDQQKVCLSQPISQNRTYSFRTIPLVNPDDKGAYGGEKPPPPPWYKKLFPFLRTPLEKYGPSDVRTLKNDYGRPVPIGETMRSKAIRAKTEQNLPEIEQKLRLPKFDWRENGLDVGEINNQGLLGCNLCWAFVSVDAMQISRRLLALRSNRSLDEKKRPSIRQLVPCMLKEAANFCNKNWHGEAFSFMVDKGLPIGGITKYKIRENSTWDCEPDEYVKALTWDFVSAKPQNAASVEEIKKAVILYGSVVSAISFDYCWTFYGGGVLNEERFVNGSHFVVIIGWDDSKGAWLVKNSYGKEWGENGFGWIKYKSNNIGQWAAFVVADPDEEGKVKSEN